MLNTKANKCLLVKGFKSHASWSFPRGKINQDESERECAIREVFEETSFSIAPLLRSGQLSDLRGIDYFEITIREQRVRMYVVVGVPEDWPFAPRTRQEISVRLFSFGALAVLSESGPSGSDGFLWWTCRRIRRSGPRQAPATPSSTWWCLL